MNPFAPVYISIIFVRTKLIQIEWYDTVDTVDNLMGGAQQLRGSASTLALDPNFYCTLAVICHLGVSTVSTGQSMNIRMVELLLQPLVGNIPFISITTMYRSFREWQSCPSHGLQGFCLTNAGEKEPSYQNKTLYENEMVINLYISKKAGGHYESICVQQQI